MKRLFSTSIAAVVLSCLPVRAASIYIENGPAGNLPATAQTVSGNGPLGAIFGNLDTLDEVDMYLIWITEPLAFSATTIGGFFNVSDPQIFLFNALGFGVYMNDDFDGSLSMLPALDPHGPIARGLYYLAIGWYDNEPFSTAGRIFEDGTGTNGPDAVGGTLPVSFWNGDVFGRPDLAGQYEIDLTGASFVTPEPASLFLLSLPLAGLFWRRRSRG